MTSTGSFASFGTVAQPGVGVCYRIGSVGHDTNLCLWDITEDMLKVREILPMNVFNEMRICSLPTCRDTEIQRSLHRCLGSKYR